MLAFSIDYYGIFFGATQSVELFCTYLRSILKVRLILLDFADYLIYYTRKEVTYELLTHEYNYWR